MTDTTETPPSENNTSGGATYRDGKELLESGREGVGGGYACVRPGVARRHLYTGVRGQTASVADQSAFLPHRARPLVPHGHRQLGDQLAREPRLHVRDLPTEQR